MGVRVLPLVPTRPGGAGFKLAGGARRSVPREPHPRGRMVRQPAVNVNRSMPLLYDIPSPLAGEGEGGGVAQMNSCDSSPPPQPSPVEGEGDAIATALR